jgi:hypothetical protein
MAVGRVFHGMEKMSDIQVSADEAEIRARQPDTISTSESFNLLKRFVRRRVASERCDLCSSELAGQHSHLIEPATRQIVCACQACSILFSANADQRYKRIPQRIQFLNDFSLSESEWDSLLIPIGMAFFFRSSTEQRVVALYPSPAGATESLLDLKTWEEFVSHNRVLQEIEPDTEALLVNRVNTAREYYIVPIDECFKLVGLIRTNWHGLSGGKEVWDSIAKFFDGLKSKSNSEAGTNA